MVKKYKSVKKYNKKYGNSRKKRMERPQRSLALKTHTFCEYLKNDKIDLNSTQLDVNGHLTISTGKSFSFADLPQVAQYSQLFYQFRILKIVAEYSWSGVGNSPPQQSYTTPIDTYQMPLGNVNAPVLLINRNHTGISLTYAEMDTSCKTKRIRLSANKRHFLSLTPSCKDVMQSTGLLTVGIPQYKTWFISDQLNASTVPHYGLTYQVDTYNAGNAIDMGNILIKYKMYFQCKGNE